MRRWLTLCCLLGAGCTFEWSSSVPTFPLTGTPPSLDSFVKLNQMPASKAALMTGVDGTPWTAFCEFSVGSGNRNCLRMHLVRLGAPGEAPREEVITSMNGFETHNHELYEFNDDKSGMTRTIVMHRPGDPPASDVAFTVPVSLVPLLTNEAGNADVFVYTIASPTSNTYEVFRRDRIFQRELVLQLSASPPDSMQPLGPGLLITTDGDTIVIRAPDGTTTAYSTRDTSQVALGTRPPNLLIDNQRKALLTIGQDGFRSVPLDGGADLVLDPIGFDRTTLSLEPQPGFRDRTTSLWPTAATSIQWALAFYARSDGLWRVPLDGSAPASLVEPGAARLVSIGPRGEIVFSHDPATRYAGGAGDGWLGDTRLMQRGRLGTFSGDGTRFRFLENAATLGTYGDLTSVPVSGGAALTLGINVHFYDELPDGRVLAVENYVYAGNWNRLVVIDEAAGTKHWVVPSTTEFFLVPGGRELIASVVDGLGFDILRVPAPFQ